MSRLRIASALLGLFLGWNQAIAADLTNDQAPYEPPMAPIWAGLYVGGHIGGIGSSDDSIEKSVRYAKWNWYKWQWKEWSEWQKVEKHGFTSDNDDDVSLLGGLHIGYNLQDGGFVYGVEADVSFSERIDYLASLRARLGYAVNELLIYATAGVAVAGFENSQLYWEGFGKKVPFGKSEDDDNRVGFVVGGGVEYKLAPSWSLGLEGLYYIFDDQSDEYSGTLYGFGYKKEYKITHENDNDFWVVRARMTYHLQDDYEAPLK
jgi:outer membrane immunogenic protein